MMSGGYVGAAYFNPADLNEKCTTSSANVADKETKTGCMKWYIYDDSGDNYKMILDHNTTKMLTANNSNKNDNTKKFLESQIKTRKQIKKLIMIIKRGQIIDIFTLIIARRRRCLPRELLFLL